jgi:hypothetical protein
MQIRTEGSRGGSDGRQEQITGDFVGGIPV